MREIKTGEGKITHLPEQRQRVEQTIASGFFHCECHERMGNDFYFLPIGSCLRPDKTCNSPSGQALDAPPGVWKPCDVCNDPVDCGSWQACKANRSMLT